MVFSIFDAISAAVVSIFALSLYLRLRNKIHPYYFQEQGTQAVRTMWLQTTGDVQVTNQQGFEGCLK